MNQTSKVIKKLTNEDFSSLVTYLKNLMDSSQLVDFKRDEKTTCVFKYEPNTKIKVLMEEMDLLSIGDSIIPTNSFLDRLIFNEIDQEITIRSIMTKGVKIAEKFLHINDEQLLIAK
jgi:hypothetical protein